MFVGYLVSAFFLYSFSLLFFAVLGIAFIITITTIMADRQTKYKKKKKIKYKKFKKKIEIVILI